MQIETTPVAGAIVIIPTIHRDDRGLFTESYNARDLAEATAIGHGFVQDNFSRSHRGVLRGLHYQLPRPQGKLVWAVSGRAWDVVVDIRRSSETFGAWFGMELDAVGMQQMWVPPGCAHGFYALEDCAMLYKTTEYFDPAASRSIAWDDPHIGIDWPLDGASPLLSPRDAAAPGMSDAPLYD